MICCHTIAILKAIFFGGKKILSFRGELKAANCEIEINEHFSELPLARKAGQWGSADLSRNGESGPLSVTNNYNQDSSNKQSESKACQERSWACMHFGHVNRERTPCQDVCKCVYVSVYPLQSLFLVELWLLRFEQIGCLQQDGKYILFSIFLVSVLKLRIHAHHQQMRSVYPKRCTLAVLWKLLFSKTAASRDTRRS